MAPQCTQSNMDSPSPPPSLQLLLADEDCGRSCVAPSCLLPRALPSTSGISSGNHHQHKHKPLLPFRPATSSFASAPRNRHVSLDNDELAGLVTALERARNEARRHSSIAQQLRRENERLRTELELKNNQLDSILQKGRQDPKASRRVFLPSSPTSTLQDTEDMGCCANFEDVKNILALNTPSTGEDSSGDDDVTAKAVQTLLRNFDSFNLLSKDNNDEDDDKANVLIGEDLVSDDDDSCSYSV